MKTEIQAAWSKAINNKDNNPYKDPTYGNKVNGKISAKEYLAYNIVRGLDPERGFKNNIDFILLARSLLYLADRVINTSGGNQSMALLLLRHRLEFFGDTVDSQAFAREAYEALRLYSNS